jgi:hypothetical protein
MIVPGGKELDWVMKLSDREDNQNGKNGESDHQCAEEIVKEILGQNGPASKLYEVRGNYSLNGTKRLAKRASARNGAFTTDKL